MNLRAIHSKRVQEVEKKISDIEDITEELNTSVREKAKCKIIPS